MHTLNRHVEEIIEQLAAKEGEGEQKRRRRSWGKLLRETTIGQEVVLRKDALREYLQTSIAEKEELKTTLEIKDKEIEKLTAALRFSEDLLAKPENSPAPHKVDFDGGRKIQELELKLSAEQKKREQAEKEVKWSQGRLKEQLMQI
jgi:hypothetical protein